MTARGVLVSAGLGIWAIGSVSLLGAGIYGLTHREASMPARVVVGVPAPGIEAPAPSEGLPGAENGPAPAPATQPASDNVPCGGGCVRASFTVVSK